MAFSLNLGNIVVSMGLDATKFDQAAKQVTSRWSSMTGQLSSIGKGVGAAAALAAGGIALVAKSAAELESELTRAAAVSQGGLKNFEAFKDAAMAASSGSAASAKEAAEGLKFLSMAGFDASQSMAALPEVIRLSTAAQIDLGRAADIASDILTGFGLKAQDLSHVNDVLTLGFTRTNTTLEMLSESMKYIGPAAASAGQSIETMTAAVGLMANVGVKGSQAGTSIRTALLRLQEPPKKAREALQALGVEVVDSQGKMRDFVDIIGQFEAAQSRFGQADFTAKVAQVVGLEAVSGFLGVINQGEGALRSLRDEMVAAQGTTKDLEQAMLNTFGGKMQVLQGNVQNLMSILGDSLLPVLSRVTDSLAALAIGLTKDEAAAASMSSTIQAAVLSLSYFIDAGAAVGQVLARVTGALADSIRGLQMLGLAAQLSGEGFKDLYAVVVSGDKDAKRASDDRARAILKQLDELASLKSAYSTSAEASDKLADGARSVAQQLREGAAQIHVTTSGLRTQEQQVKSATAALDTYAKTWGGLREQANLVDMPKLGILKAPPSDMSKAFAQTDTRQIKKTSRDKAVDSAREELRLAENRKEVLRWEIAALEEKDRLNQIELQLQAKIAQLGARKMSEAERELEINKLALEADRERTREIERQAAARKADLDARSKQMIEMLDVNKPGKSKAAQAEEDLTEEEEAAEEQKKMIRSGINSVLEVMDVFTSNLGGFGQALKPLVNGISKTLDGFMENGALGALQAGLTSAVTSLLTIVMENKEFQKHVKVMEKAVAELGLPDLLSDFMASFRGAIGAVISVMRSLKPLISLDGLFDGFGVMIFNSVKQMLQAVLKIAETYYWAKSSLLKVAGMMANAIAAVLNQAADLVGKLPFVNRPNTDAVNRMARDMNRSADEATSSLDTVRDAQRSLADLTYEQAVAIYDEIEARDEATESLKELNDELRNAPAGFKIALARFEATDAARDPRSRSGGSGTVTVGQVMVTAEDPARFLDALRMEAYELTGSTEAVFSSRFARKARARR